jgi:hypothetical protein
MGTTNSDARAAISAAETAIQQSIDRIESSLDRVAPQTRSRLDGVLTALRHQLDTLAPVGEDLGQAAAKGAERADSAARGATARLAKAAERLADAVSQARCRRAEEQSRPVRRPSQTRRGPHLVNSGAPPAGAERPAPWGRYSSSQWLPQSCWPAACSGGSARASTAWPDRALATMAGGMLRAPPVLHVGRAAPMEEGRTAQ